MIATYLGTVTNTSMAFYMMPFRISEFALGAMLCWLPQTKISQTARELLVLAALSVMLLCFLIISGEYTFPGLWFLAPCVATSVLIHIGNESIISRALLENRVSTYIGRLSYSLYLFHWPVIIFFKNELSTSLFLEDQIAIFLTAIMLAMITYHLVELPLRHPATIWPSKRQVAINFVIGVVVLTVSFSWVVYQKGLPERIPAQIRSIVETADIEKSRRFDILRMLCRERGWDKCEELDHTQFNVLILGDSHGDDALTALHGEWPRPHYILYSENGCPPMTISDFDLTVKKNAKHYSKCRNKTQLLADGTIVKMADMLVVSSRYSWYTPSMLNRFLDSLELPLDYLIVIFGQAPTYSKGLPEIIYQHGQLAGLKERAAGFLTEETWMFNDELEQVASSHKAIFIPKAGYFCEAQTNQCELFYGEENKLLTYDKNHMSYEAAIELGNRISATWPQLIKED